MIPTHAHKSPQPPGYSSRQQDLKPPRREQEESKIAARIPGQYREKYVECWSQLRFLIPSARRPHKSARPVSVDCLEWLTSSTSIWNSGRAHSAIQTRSAKEETKIHFERSLRYWIAMCVGVPEVGVHLGVNLLEAPPPSLSVCAPSIHLRAGEGA
ncbi:hypothetical protein LY78DRAFT_147442 [Colletotrichum sublineola]|nr:hypothetical protein LY78DRAFT_147442 [Colletotrichum sublineola]